MKVSLNWLGEMVELPRGVQPLVDLLTLAGIEVESIDERGRNIPNVVAAEIVESVPHPNADRLSVCSVNDGTGTRRQIVCGAKNYRVGDKVPLALPGAVLPGDFKIKVGKLRGVESQGMLCSAKELNLAEDAEGLVILSPDALPGTPLGEIFPADTVLDLEITPNRPDLLSYAGIAREIGALLNFPVRFPALRTTETVAAANDVEIAVEGCPFYSVRRIDGVRIGPSPEWLDRKLRAAGLNPINNVVDVTNYVMLELGQPLHAFDAAKVSGAIRVRSAERDEEIAALDGKTYRLAPGDIVIADASAARAIGGIMGGKDSAVTTETSAIWLEAAEFQPQRIRRTSRRLGLSSDSSYRFERGIDRQGVMVASQRATELITEVAGGRALAPIRMGETPAAPERAKERSISFHPPTSGEDANEKQALSKELESAGSPIPLRPERVKALLGIEVPEQQMRDILIRLGLKADGENWRAPSFRADLTREVDLIEEIARVLGMEAIPSRMQARYAPSSEADGCYDRLIETRRACVRQGLIEARSLVLIPEMPLGSGYTGWGQLQTLRVKNPMIEDQVLLRPHLLHGLLRAVQTNAHAGERSVRLFEIGRVYSQAAPEESTHLAIVLSGAIEERCWRRSSAPDADMSLLKGILEAVFAGTVSFERQNNPELALAVRIAIHNAPLGFAGQLTESAARALDANAPVLFAEIALDDLVRKALPPRRAQELPRFPAVSRDIALLVSLEVMHAQIVAVLERAQEPLLVHIELFDLFIDETGEKLPRDKKSLAYSLTYRAPERTLTAIEVNAAHARLKERLKSELSVVLRE